MLSERAHRSIHVESPLSPDDLRNALSQCGEIQGVYAAAPAKDPLRSRYFVEFREPRLASHAELLQLPGTAIVSLKSSPHMVEEYHSVVTPNLPPKPRDDVLQTARWSPYRKPHKKPRHTQQSPDRHRSPTRTVLQPAATLMHATLPAPDSSKQQAESFKENNSVSGLTISWNGALPRATSSLNSLPANPTTYTQRNSQTVPSLKSISQTCSSSSTLSAGGHVSFDKANTYRFDGCDHVQINLDRLSSSGEEEVKILRLTASNPAECGKWMLVGAHYRRCGNVQAAIQVVNTMIEVMLSEGMAMSQLKPAVLMVSSCHLDIARELRVKNGRETNESRSHLDQACEGFRKIYGAYQPPLYAASAAEAISCPESTSPLADTPSSPDGGSTGCHTPTVSTPKPALRTIGVVATSGTSTASPTGPRHGHIKMLEREVQSLRDRQQKHRETLERTRVAKRKLEDDLDKEVHRRRKIEGQLENAERAAAGARRGEEHALEQCRMEVETRRHAEDRIVKLKERIADIEPRVAESEERERKIRECFGRLGVVFLKAARGDAGDISAIVSI